MAMVENNFDWWRKDVFFSAAEEVQESADVMESVYRAWDRERRESLQSDGLEELRRELQTALGITKWQLEEFEKAVKSSHQKYLGENAVARHRQFVTAIETQISLIEKALRDSLVEEGKQPLRWVQLDENERDDLALFLSGPAEVSQGSVLSLSIEADVTGKSKPETLKSYREMITIDRDAKYVVELAAKDLPETRKKMQNPGESSNGQSQMCSSPDTGAWEIVISNENRQKDSLDGGHEAPSQGFNFWRLLRSIEISANLRLLRNSFRKVKHREDTGEEMVSSSVKLRALLPVTQGMNTSSDRSRGCYGTCIRSSSILPVRQLFKRMGAFRRQVQCSQYHVKISSPRQIYFILMLLLLFFVPLLIYAS